MNDERSGSAARPSEALAADSELAGFAAPAAATKRAAPADPQALTHREKRLIAISMMLPVFLGSVDQSVLASALPTIGRDLGDVHNLPWLITAFLIASTALTPLYGKFADIHGRRLKMQESPGWGALSWLHNSKFSSGIVATKDTRRSPCNPPQTAGYAAPTSMSYQSSSTS